MFLSSSQRRAVAALGDTLFPCIGEGDPSGADVVPDALEEFFAKMAPAARAKLSMAIRLFDLGALPVHGRRFSALDAQRRTRYVQGCIDSRITLRRMLYKALREVCGFVYYQDARTWKFIGHPGPAVSQESL